MNKPKYITATVARIERLRKDLNGNPRFSVTLSDPSDGTDHNGAVWTTRTFFTRPSAMSSYSISDSLIGKRVACDVGTYYCRHSIGAIHPIKD